MLIQALLVALIATMSSWWVTHTITRTWLYPLWSGFLVALAMGEPIKGMMAAAYINLAYLGWITAGGTMPGNLMVAGVFGTALTLLSGADPKMAITFAVPFSMLGILTWQAYMTINSLWVHRADRYAEEGNLKGILLMNWIPSGILSFILNGIPAFLMVYYGGGFMKRLLASIPQSLVNGFNVVGALMPALGIAMLLDYIGKKNLIPYYLIGFFAATYLKLDIMAVTVFGALIAIIMYSKENLFSTKGGEA
ncbi:phosphotransferase system PTS sorbose-specific IIC subunit [Thermoanaerobacterium thermosaccharolyticum DSM 571]|uniref:Phosphotransferase system PTS sorbose-specific IIC subunit n=1 Tax=Thermoanaerobacterium thermosaccharolyticum (strain ATCC 7956 / DSM 571 / NCIMB 9385 / NCA 3814 / NCTC 13789 / WDCM 00135 / 2032) TaxID=580327 RepID=D9TQJ7_THETC|nr:PTS sugar transporter subunit IIC [Thermoanaerobacterium thermosaccharolyticum]ADL69231.1 phosphotransferase system PTS sorbose-specific IIC subunit [Thermoanaerobacterium thermosaccharolyticum DSM 571]TCW31999.1 PTS system mannose-specific IIC component [Thermohydrogenium kirishiense]